MVIVVTVVMCVTVLTVVITVICVTVVTVVIYGLKCLGKIIA